jgi:hypothetical protein
MRAWRFRCAMVVVVASAMSALLFPSSAAAEDDPPYIGWSALLPPLTYGYEPSSADDCRAGRPQCVRATIAEMQSRFDALARTCDHDAVFALTYLRTTEAYLDHSQTPGFLGDPAFVNHQDVVFAQLYFDAYDNFGAGRLERVPGAWQIALSAADGRRVNGLGNLLLGMNAHVNRDLPFVLAAIGMVQPSGHSRKADHDKINVMLNHVVQSLITEAAARFDPQIPNIRTPFGVGYTGLLQALVLWRELAWRNAELLVAAPTPAARDLVAAQIEAYAAATARALVVATGYLPPLVSTIPRDNFCRAQ